MAEYQRCSAPRGSVYYSSQGPVEPAPEQGYFQPRRVRPQILRIGRPKSLDDIEFPRRRRGLKRDSSTRTSTTITTAKKSIKRFIQKSGLDKPLGGQEAGLNSPANLASLGVPLAPCTRRSFLRAIEGRIVSGDWSEASSIDMSQRQSMAEEIRSGAGTPTPNPQARLFAPVENEKPVASGNGVSVSINLAEPILFLQGFDPSDFEERNTTMLRGSLHLRVTKTAKIKTIYLKFRGKAETEWPEGTGIPPKRTEYRSTESLMNHTWPFFNAAWQNTDSCHGADSVQPLKGSATATTREILPPGGGSALKSNQLGPTPKDVKRLSLQDVQSRSFGKSDTNVSTTQKGYRTFTPGNYIYNFELPIDSRLPESIDVELGSVKYELEAIVERAGAFRANLVGSKEVVLIRAPTEGSLETVEPIAISRDWEDQLHYDIVISGKSFPLGSQVPIAFKLTPLAKVRCHRIKVYITENIQYFTGNKRVHRMEPTRRIQLFEKRADGPSQSAYPGSSLRITAGGGVDYDAREAAASGDESVPRDYTNLLGPLEGEHNSIGPTEMEIGVQLPSCHAMDEREKAARIHFDTTYSNIQVHHWIKIVMRLSRPDTEDPTRHRHFEISIDSPFHILSCRATQANMALPAYSSPESATLLTDHSECGCPGAPRRRNLPLSMASTLSNPQNDPSASSTSLSSGSNNEPPLAPPPAAHVHDQATERVSDPRGVPRPMHLLRAPSFNPPPFSDEDPPPPLITPPPNYENAVDGDPRNALADYFSRLADEVGEDDEAVSLTARMDMPLTPGGRINRSMDERRTWESFGVGVS